MYTYMLYLCVIYMSNKIKTNLGAMFTYNAYHWLALHHLSHLVESVRNDNLYMRVEERQLAIAHTLMLGAGVITHNVHVTAACKTLSHTQFTVSYCHNPGGT